MFNAKQVEQNLKKEVQTTVQSMRDEFAARSPVKTGRYEQSWRYTVKGLTGKVFNAQPYGVFIEGGYPPPTSKGLVESNGKLWSKKAIGGTVDPFIGKQGTSVFATAFSIRLADAVIRGL